MNYTIYILELENRCIMAGLPHVLGDKRTYQSKPGELFWEIVDVSSYVSFSNILYHSANSFLYAVYCKDVMMELVKEVIDCGDKYLYKSLMSSYHCHNPNIKLSHSNTSCAVLLMHACILLFCNRTDELFLFYNQQDDSVGEVTRKIQQCTSPRLLSTGTLSKMHCLMIVAEGMVVAKLKAINILNAVICLLSAYYAFNAEYPKGVTGHSKNVFLFLEHLLIPCSEKKKSLPLSVEHFISLMK